MKIAVVSDRATHEVIASIPLDANGKAVLRQDVELTVENQDNEEYAHAMNDSGMPIGFDETPPDEREVNMKKLETIQQENRLNDVFALDEPGPGGARHLYQVFRQGALEGDTLLHRNMDLGKLVLSIEFNGPRSEPGSMRGVTDADLLEIVRDRLTDFQSGPYPSPETADALRYVTEALLCLNRRTQDRAQRGVLGRNTP